MTLLRALIVVAPLALLVAGAALVSLPLSLSVAGLYLWIELRPIWSKQK